MTKVPVKKGDEMIDEPSNQSTCDSLCKPIIELTGELESLKNELRERQLIEKAKGVLIRSKGVSEQEASAMLQSFMVQQNKSLSEAANIVLLGEKMLNQAPQK
ncbi:MAG: ANTAR domain-containing protein [Deltaproteobacteria bacterium]|nr:ANTAR domain-containing protein [Deltaproteobacteria bacterium]